MKEKLSPQIVGNVGMHYVCYKLSLKGWNVMPTARNAKGIDIVAYNESGKKFVGIQVKTLSKKATVPLGNSLDKIMGDYWVVVNNVVSEDKRKAFVLKPNEVKRLAEEKENKKGEVSYWLQPKNYDKCEFAENWDRIGRR